MKLNVLTWFVGRDKNVMLEGVQEDGRGVRWGDRQPPHKDIKNSRHGTAPTKQPLGDSRRRQASRGTG